MPANAKHLYIVSITMLNSLAGILIWVLSIPLPPAVAIEPYIPPSPRVVANVRPVIYQSIPERLSVPSLNINMSVERGSFDPASSQWTDNGLNASYADMSVPVNNSNGTTLIFAHAQWGAFAALPTIQMGATAEVQGKDGKSYVYKARQIKQVQPEDTSVFQETGPSKLVLQTCSGPWDAYRTLVYFDFVKVVS